MSDHNETRDNMSHDPNVMSDDLGPVSGLDWSTVFQRPATVDPPREFRVGDRIQIGEQVVTVTAVIPTEDAGVQSFRCDPYDPPPPFVGEVAAAVGLDSVEVEEMLDDLHRAGFDIVRAEREVSS